MSDFIVAFVGLPSSGKSTLINSLLGKRKLQTGTSKTTNKAVFIETLIADDDKNKFRVIDLPGICNTEVQDIFVNNLTYAYILRATLIFWVSDVKTAFSTEYEVNEFNKLQEYLNEHSKNNIRLYDIGIILSNCSEYVNINDDGNIVLNKYINIIDVINKTQEKFKDIKIKLFNAFGRIYHHPISSDISKKFLKSRLLYVPSTENIYFSITEYIKTYKHRQSKYILYLLYKEFPYYSNNVYNEITYNRIITLYNLLDETLIISFLNTIFKKYIKMDWTCFKFLNYVYTNSLNLSNATNIIDSYQILYLKYLIKIINTDAYSIYINLVSDCTIETIITELSKCKEKYRLYFDIFIHNVIFEYTNISTRCKNILLDLYKIDNNSSDFIIIRTILYKAFKTKDTYAVKYIYEWLITNFEKYNSLRNNEIIHHGLVNNIILDDINLYLKNLKILINNKYYILLNKAYVYKILYVKDSIWMNWKSHSNYNNNSEIPLAHHFNYIKTQSLINTQYNHIYIRILEISSFNDLINIGMYNIYENIAQPVNNINNIKPLHISEVICN